MHRQIYLQRDLPGPGMRPGLVPRHNPLSHVGFEVSHTTILRPVWEERDTTDKTQRRRNLKMFEKEPPCSSMKHLYVCLPSPRWRTLCCGCRPGVSVYAAAGSDALLNSSGSSRDRRRSRGGPGTAIVFHRITGRHTSHVIYTRQQWTRRCPYTGTHTAHTHTQTHISRGTMSHVITKAGRWIVLLQL